MVFVIKAIGHKSIPLYSVLKIHTIQSCKRFALQIACASAVHTRKSHGLQKRGLQTLAWPNTFGDGLLRSPSAKCYGHLNTYSPLLLTKRFCSSQQSDEAKEEAKPRPEIVIPKNIPIKHEEYGDLVYMPPLYSRVRNVKAFSLGTSAFYIGMQPYLWTHGQELPAVLKVAVLSTLSFFLFLTPVALHWMTKRYVLHMYYNRDTKVFTALTYTFFLQKRRHIFTVDDIEYGDNPKFVSNFTVNKFPMVIDSEFFLDNDVYMHLMGYDRSLEWLLRMKEKDAKN